VPYEERQEAKALGARWDAVRKAWYVGPGVEPEKIAKWELRHQETATLDPRAEFAEVLKSCAVLEGSSKASTQSWTGKRTVCGQKRINVEKRRSFTAQPKAHDLWHSIMTEVLRHACPEAFDAMA